MRSIYKYLLSLFILVSCNTLDVFEKDLPVPGHRWESNFQPSIEFEINDTSSFYNVYIVLRHTNEYRYNNVWIKASVKEPGSPDLKSRQYDLLLANNNKGWLCSGMDDIFDHRILIQPQTKFNKSGKYQFTLQQIMREDPLPHVMNVGLRIEKVH